MKTTTVSVYAAFFFILVLSISCHRDSEAPDAAFQRIEMCMESLPDTALYLLKSIPHTEKLRGKLQADYALLLTQAMDQNYVKFTSDSLIALAWVPSSGSRPIMKSVSKIAFREAFLLG